MSPEAKAVRAQYMRAWREKNPEKVKQYRERAWEKKAAAQYETKKQSTKIRT